MPIDFMAALAGARTVAQVDEIARVLWGANGAGLIAVEDVDRIAAQVEEVRQRISLKDNTVRDRAPGVPLATFSNCLSRRRRCVSPDRLASRARRRNLGLAGALPHALAARFTEGQRAVLAIVATEVRDKDACELPLEAIAARAGVCVTLARNAIRLAAGDGLAVIVERRRAGRPNLPNVVRIVSREWLAWIKRPGGGCRKINPTDYKNLTPVQDDALRAKQPIERRVDEGGAHLPPPSASSGVLADGRPRLGRESEPGNPAFSRPSQWHGRRAGVDGGAGSSDDRRCAKACAARAAGTER